MTDLPVMINNELARWIGREEPKSDAEEKLISWATKALSENDKRTARQYVGDIKWVRSNGIGTIEWPTGVGKTRAAVAIIELLCRKDADRNAIVVVPTSQLKKQWEDIMKSNKLLNVKVVIINSLIRYKWKCSLLICDEIHRYAAKTFAKVFDVVKYDFILGLTATMKRIDLKHSLLVKYAPIIDSMSIAEARRDGYIADYVEYNLGVEMTEEQSMLYNSLREQYNVMINKFRGDFSIMRMASLGAKPGYNAEKKEYWEPYSVKLAKSYGWRGNSAERAYSIMEANKDRPRGQKVDIWGGNLTHPYRPSILNGMAINGMRLNRAMKEFVYKMPQKIDLAVELALSLNRKTIIFSELIETAEELAEKIGDRAILYHSKIKAKIVDGKKVSGAALKRQAIERVNSSENPDIICTAKALDQGSDFPGLSLGIGISRTSSKTQQTQRRGRVVRKHMFSDGSEKSAIFINIYAKDTRDVNWLSSAQKGSLGIVWVDSVQELLEFEGLSKQN